MSKQTPWEQQVNEFKSKHKFKPEFDLIRDFQELHLWPERRDLLQSELKQKLKDLNEQKKKAKKEIAALRKSLKLPICDQEVINILNKTIQKYSDVIGFNILIPQRYSKPMMYISRLCAIFYEGTGIFPEVVSPKVKGKSSYRGNFYDFLLETKPLLKEIGIELPNYETLGKYAYQVVNGNKSKGIISFAELKEEIRSDSL
ncbi:hypothetical protein SC588_06880 [Legionella pneumophila]|nr:hypothetical protein [Legionella pneumophila]